MICVECVHCGARNTTFLDDSTANPSLTCHGCGQVLPATGNAVNEPSAAAGASAPGNGTHRGETPWVVSEHDIVSASAARQPANHVEVPWVVSEQDIVPAVAPVADAPVRDVSGGDAPGASEQARLAALRVSMVVDPDGWDDDAAMAPLPIVHDEPSAAPPEPATTLVEPAATNPIVETLVADAMVAGAPLPPPPPELVAAAREFVEHSTHREVAESTAADDNETRRASAFPAAAAIPELQDAVSDSVPIAQATPVAPHELEQATTAQEPEVAPPPPVLAVLRGEEGSGALAAALAATAPNPRNAAAVEPETLATGAEDVAQAPAASPSLGAEAPVSLRPESPASESRLPTDAPVARSVSGADVRPTIAPRSRQYVAAAAAAAALVVAFFTGRATKHTPGQAEIEAAAAALVASRETAPPKAEPALAPAAAPAAVPEPSALPAPTEPDVSAATIVPTRASQRAAALGIKSTFDSNVAGRLLGEAAARASSCKRPGENSAQATITVTFGPSGKVAGANVSGMQFSNLGVRNCIGQILKRVRVPAFNGTAVTVKKVVKI